jgi:hypothetical protein
VDQKAIKKAQLWPYLKRVQKRIAKNPDSVAWVTLDERWRALTDHARGVLARFATGRAGVRYERLAAQEIVKLADDVPPRAVVEVTAAMVLMWEMEPRQFKSDQAFWLQLARRVRGLTDMNYGEGWDNVRQRVRRSYRELTPKASLILGQWLATALGVAGQYMARAERAEVEKQESERRALHEALAKLS